MSSLLLLSSYVEEVVAGYAVGSISLILIGVSLFILLTYALGLDVENVQLELLFFIACHVAIISHKKK